MSLQQKTLFVALLVGLAHILSGIAVMVTPQALNVTPLASLHYASAWLGFSGKFAGFVLMAAGIMAVIGASLDLAMPRSVHAALFMPQQLLLLLQLWTVSTALVVGHYPDGYTPVGGAWFILTDQSWAFVLAATHSIWLAAFIYGGKGRGVSGTT